jgi:hypothetical protein
VPQTTVLLGAGASKDAGLPLSSDLTEQITERIQAGRRPGRPVINSALNQVIGAIIAHDTRHGRGPFDGIDVERLFSAIKMLSEKETLEIAPFVSSWSDSNVVATNDLSNSWEKRFRDEVAVPSEKAWPHKMKEVFIEGVLALTRAGSGSTTYKTLMAVIKH